MKPIIIVAPYYTHSSNGIRALHDMCHQINQMGGTAKLLFLNCDRIVGGDVKPTDAYGMGIPTVNPAWNTPVLQNNERHLIDNGIVIYPETMTGNPLNAPRVARWVGNKEGVLRQGAGMGASATDFIIAHSKVLRKNPDYVLYYSHVNPCFNDDDAVPEKRVMNATYIGKGYLYGDVAILKNTIWIERLYPSTQEQLAFLLKHVACFYTYDSWTQTNVDAILCGCVPFFLRYPPFTQEEVDGSELGVIPRLDRMNPSFDLLKFTDQRAALKARIAELQASWNDRIKGLLDKLESHWGD